MSVEIVRTWSGVTSRDNAEPYLRHLREDTLPQLRALSGFLGWEVMRRELDGAEVQFVVQTRWASMEAVLGFAGEAPSVAVVPAAARACLERFDERVEHFTVAMSEGAAGAG